jgi:hypothetical protein
VKPHRSSKMASKQHSPEKIDVLSNTPPHIGDEDEDEVAPEAIGGTTADLPPGYYHSASFIGTVAVSYERIETCHCIDLRLL